MPPPFFSSPGGGGGFAPAASSSSALWSFGSSPASPYALLLAAQGRCELARRCCRLGRPSLRATRKRLVRTKHAARQPGGTKAAEGAQLDHTGAVEARIKGLREDVEDYRRELDILRQERLAAERSERLQRHMRDASGLAAKPGRQAQA